MIPREFHRLWYGPRQIPDRYVRYGDTWATQNPGWTITTHTDYRPRQLGDDWDSVGTTRRVHVGGGKDGIGQAVQRADIASYELLYERGGVYLNCDMEALRPIGDLLDGLDLFLVWEVDGLFPTNAIFGATAGHPFIAHLMELLPQRLDRVGSMNEQTGPHLVRHALETWTGDVTVFPSSMFLPYSYDQMNEGGDYPDAYAEHHWGHKIPDETLYS